MHIIQSLPGISQQTFKSNSVRFSPQSTKSVSPIGWDVLVCISVWWRWTTEIWSVPPSWIQNIGYVTRDAGYLRMLLLHLPNHEPWHLGEHTTLNTSVPSMYPYARYPTLRCGVTWEILRYTTELGTHIYTLAI